MSLRIRIWVVLGLIALLIPPVVAQTATGRITGTVADASGAVLPGVTVVALNEETGVSYETLSGDTGAYTFEALIAGVYTVSAELAGFKKYSTSKNVLTANDTVTINLRLEVGEITETVEVQSTYDKVQTSQSGNIGAIVNNVTLENLPLLSRNPLELIVMQPGVVQGSNTGGGTHVFGARDRAINITLDGIDANETSAGNATFSPLRTNPDSLREYRVITSNGSAEFGRNSGAQVAMITKSGSNEFHGDLFWFHRNRVLNANEWSLNRQAIPRRFLLRNVFGGSIGGPIFKDRTHFFFNVQAQRQIQTLQQTATVYTDTARKGIFRYVVGGRNFAAGTADPSVDRQGNPLPGKTIGTYNVVANDPRAQSLDPTVQSILGLTVLPNNFEVGDGLNTAGFTYLATRTDPQRDFTTRFDHVLNETNSLFVRYSWGKQDTVGDTTNAGAARFPGLPPIVATIREPRNLAVGWRSTLSSRTVNELIVGGNHFLFDFAIPTADDPRATPIVTVNVTDPLSKAFGNRRTINTYQIADNLSHSRGAHTLRAGINLRLQQHYDVRGTVAGLNILPQVYLGGPIDPTLYKLPATGAGAMSTFDRTRLQGTINDLLGKVNRLDVGLVAVGGRYAPAGTPFNIDAWYPEYDFYFQDDWKILPNLTVNLGLRYEPKPKPYTRGATKIFVPNKPVTAGSAPATDVTWVEGDLYKSDLDNWAPSVGVAWDPHGDGKTAVRGNFRIAYDRISTFLPSSAVYPAAPGATLAVINTAFGQGGGRLRDGLPVLAAPTGVSPTALAKPGVPGNLSQEIMDPNFQSPKTYMWSFGIQRDVGAGWVAEAMYIGRAGRNLLGGYARNQVDITKNGFLQAFKTAQSGGESALLDQLTAGHPNRLASESGAAFLRRFFTAPLANHNVASVAGALAVPFTIGGQVTTLPKRNGLGEFFFLPYPQLIGGLAIIDSESFSNYHGAVFQVQRRFQGGLEFQGSYTLSKSLDDKSYDPTFTRITGGGGQTAQSTPLDAANRRLTYGRSDFDRTHVWQANWVYQLPFGPGRRFGTSGGALERLIGGWEVGGIFLYETGRPFTVVSGTNSFSNVGQSRANFSGDDYSIGKVKDDPATGLPYLFTPEQRALFSIPSAGDYGNQPRNAFRLPSYWNLDASLIKKTRIREEMNLEFRAEISNLTNSVSWGFPASAATSRATLGRITGTASSARVIQLGMKFNF